MLACIFRSEHPANTHSFDLWKKIYQHQNLCANPWVKRCSNSSIAGASAWRQSCPIAWRWRCVDFVICLLPPTFLTTRCHFREKIYRCPAAFSSAHELISPLLRRGIVQYSYFKIHGLQKKLQITYLYSKIFGKYSKKTDTSKKQLISSQVPVPCFSAAETVHCAV